MSASQGRSGGSHGLGHAVAGDDWETKVVMTLIKVCLEGPGGQSSVDALRDALIAYFPSVLPSMKIKYGKFTAFLKAYSDYFQINPYDRTVRLTSIHPDLQAPQRHHYDVSSHHTMPEHTHSHPYTYNPSHNPHSAMLNGPGYSMNSEPPSRSSTASSIASSSSTGSRSRNIYHASSNAPPTPELSASPRGHIPSMASRRLSTQSSVSASSGSSTSSSAGSNIPVMGLGGTIGVSVVGGTGMHSQVSATSSMSGIPTHVPVPHKHVAFSSLEPWEQMTVFAVLKTLLFAPTGIEHYSTLQERLSDPQLLVKYSNICNLLCLFPGNFNVDSQGYVSLTDPAKARQQYPTLAAEFEKRISAPQPTSTETTSPIFIAIRNATSPWEKALLKTIWTTLMAQANHAANFPWLTTQLTRFKPHVKTSYGSLRLWAIQQTLFKFQGDTIYIPIHIATAHSHSINGTTPANVATGVTNPTPSASSVGAVNLGIGGSRSITSSSGYASVNSANFSIPVPPALPQRRAPTPAGVPPPPQGPPPVKNLPKSRAPSVPLHSEPIIYAVDDSSYRSRGRQLSSTSSTSSGAGSHKRQRSASPTSVRQMQDLAASAQGHGRSFSVAQTTDDIEGSRRESDGIVLTRVDRAHMPKLQLPGLLGALPVVQTGKESHLFSRKHGLASEMGATQGHRETGLLRNHTHDGGSSNPALGNSSSSNQPLSPRRGVTNPLQVLDKEIANLTQVPLCINKTSVNIKPVLHLDDLKKMVQFLSSCSSIAISVELGDVEPVSARRQTTRTSTAGTISPEEAISPRSAVSHNYSVGSSPGDAFGSSESRTTGLVVGSAPSNFGTSPLDMLGTGSAQLSNSAVHSRFSSGPRELNESEAASSLEDSETRKSKSRRHHHSRSGSGDVASEKHTSTSHRHLKIPTDTHITGGRTDTLTSTSNGSIASTGSSSRHHRGRSMSHETLTMSSSREDIPSIIHEDREPDFSHTIKDVTIMCLTARTLHVNSQYAPSSTLTGHDDKNLFRHHPVFVLDLRENPKFYRWLRPLLQSQSVTKIVYACPKLADVLYTHHGIHLSNIVDIQVLHRFLWEIGTLPLRFMHATGLDIGSPEDGLSKSSELKNTEVGKSVDSVSSVIIKSPQNSTNKLPQSGTSIGSGGTAGMKSGGAVCGTTCPPLDVPLGKLLHYFGIQLSGINVASTHPLYDACLIDLNSAPLRTGMWPTFSVNPSSILHVAASCAVLGDLRILIATQLEVSFVKSALQLSQGYSHMHLPEFQSTEASSASHDAFTPLSHDHWMDAPELFSHLSEGHD